ncbi:hypothetical protein ACS0TY_026363 [Phlomoides rotata]
MGLGMGGSFFRGKIGLLLIPPKSLTSSLVTPPQFASPFAARYRRTINRPLRRRSQHRNCRRSNQGKGRRRLLNDGERSGLIPISGHMLMSRMGHRGFSVLYARSLGGSICETHIEMKAVGMCR